ncbi:glucose-1-phosphate cytidylyltransferase [Caulobacter sp. Root1472]|uniref:glucose-1-phosphate cytidylyltransferase n=1 Tax=Caulobacter sp. Root1472 TaxID=1736470 RepID=UPI0006F4BBB8|nr:glucose-1-phosphate cytidylyltransferase [Caulobacter sp. Root1472]KQZ29862.1 glucose-1-phosphate cytidylyltransferase [Caulobacter sp. Root1472]
MKAVILAGGLGSRLGEETHLRPKPMVSIGEQPILWHVMKMYSQHGINDFVICLGYKGYVIKEFFSNYFLHTSDVTFDLAENSMEVHRNSAEPWKVTLVDTGATTMTGGRVRRVAPFVKDEESFCLTYGDGVSDIDIKASLDFHRAHGKLCTVTGVRPPGRFGALTLQGDQVERFEEKPVGDGSWINGGFFVMSPKIIDYIPEDDGSVWEQRPMRDLAADGQLQAYLHDGFWQCMDTVRDRAVLEELWASGKAPWKSW